MIKSLLSGNLDAAKLLTSWHIPIICIFWPRHAVCRYAVRDSWDNAQLKQGVVAAFVVAKTSGAASSVIEQSAELALAEPALWSLVVDHLLKDTITFAAALVALQLAVQRQIVTPSSGPP